MIVCLISSVLFCDIHLYCGFKIMFQMVEGPGCKLKGEKLKATTAGQVVKGVAGKIINNKPKKMSNSSSPYHLLLGQKIVDVKTLGKELFIILDH